MPRRVLHLVPATPFGGIQRFVANLASEQKRQGIDAMVVAVYNDARFQHVLAQANVPHEIVGAARPSLGAAAQLNRVLHRCSPDIVHLHAALLWIVATGLVGKRVPWIYHAHSYSGANAMAKSWLMEHLLVHLCDARIAVSKSVADNERRRSRRECPTFVAYNGIELDGTETKPKMSGDGAPVFGFASRLVKDKGLSAFVKVASEIIKLQPRARFLVAGDGEDFRAFETEMESEGVFKHVTMLGYLDDMASFWSAIDVYLFVAPRDTFGLTIVEAMARRIPVAAYRTGAGSDEILAHDENSLLADYGHSPQLARCAVALCREPQLRERITENALAKVNNNFTIAKCAERIAEVYSSICPAASRLS